ncbi:uncharacterized protein LAJ45_11301 [Morchella importuna]|uniref:uncharacterized protein n=1 Tax=Morchella importuna TaxID=1174673 RepID=UPI001E8DDDFD|nr:uncharacterized protein LAJ45_11301 [Morchella importuna]KAH8144707.1 hypothetical protein LAJ45_11301 [Morchella importuna]
MFGDIATLQSLALEYCGDVGQSFSLSHVRSRLLVGPFFGPQTPTLHHTISLAGHDFMERRFMLINDGLIV